MVHTADLFLGRQLSVTISQKAVWVPELLWKHWKRENMCLSETNAQTRLWHESQRIFILLERSVLCPREVRVSN